MRSKDEVAGVAPADSTAAKDALKRVAAPAPQAFRATPAWFRALTWVVQRVGWRARLLEYALPLIEREAISTVQVPWWRKPRLWRRGFLSESEVLYDLKSRSAADYVSDVERFLGTRLINGSRAVLLDDKLLFDRLLEPFAELKPRLYGLLDGPRIYPLGTPPDEENALDIAGLLERQGHLVVKPSSGGGGKGVALLAAAPGGTYRINGRTVTRDDLAQHGRLSERLMVTERVAQHPVLRKLYPKTVNTLRVITMQDAEGRAFIARAILRIGCPQSEPTDNWSRGGLSASVDLETGEVGRAATYPARRDRVIWHSNHPDSGARISGITVPNWQEITDRIREVADSLPFLPYVGWDVLPTEDGFKILEGNSYSDVNLLQIHAPLLCDPRIREFLHRHGALQR